jgi:alkanesulfonate monooxygenase SsuD/methylene tetrahydromethanopterin reductase-like flavin-dependent oxidoreductase (luciferase family)
VHAQQLQVVQAKAHDAVVRAAARVAPAERGLFAGTPEQIREDARRLEALGVNELLFALAPPQGRDGLAGYLATMEQARRAVAE